MAGDANSGPRPLRQLVRHLLAPELDIKLKDLAGKRVLLRVDFNVPVDEATGTITDASRVAATLPTIRELVSQRARVILASHFGRPEPKTQSRQEMATSYSLRPVSVLLASELGTDIFRGLAGDCIGPEAETAVSELQPGQVSIWLFNLSTGATTPHCRICLVQACNGTITAARMERCIG
jgi:phosphoglycerate kinase